MLPIKPVQGSDWPRAGLALEAYLAAEAQIGCGGLPLFCRVCVYVCVCVQAKFRSAESRAVLHALRTSGTIATTNTTTIAMYLAVKRAVCERRDYAVNDFCVVTTAGVYSALSFQEQQVATQRSICRTTAMPEAGCCWWCSEQDRAGSACIARKVCAVKRIICSPSLRSTRCDCGFPPAEKEVEAISAACS